MEIKARFVRRQVLRYCLAMNALLLRPVEAHSRGIAPLRDILSANFRSSEMRMVTVNKLTTYFVTLALEGAITALRIGLANTTPVPYRIAGASFRKQSSGSSGRTDGWNCLTFPKYESASCSSRQHGFTIDGNTPRETGSDEV